MKRVSRKRIRSRLMWAVRRTLAIDLVLVLAACLCTPRNAMASGNADIEIQVKAAFIYNFARFVEWPPQPASAPLRIGILGHGDLESPLEEIIRGKSANGRPVEVAHFNTPAEADGVEILLIERSESKHLKEIAQALAGKPVLTVCDGGNCLRDGGMIAFQIVQESVRFQINQEAAEHAGMRISSQLLKVAIPSAGKHP